MNVSDIMTKKPVTARLDTTLREALEMMHQNNCHHLPVLGTNGHLIGILSDRDCRTALNSPHTLRERWQDEELAEPPAGSCHDDACPHRHSPGRPRR